MNSQRTSNDSSRPGWTYPLLVGLLLLGISAVYGGGSLVFDPSGGLLRLPLAWIQGTVFDNYLIPGLLLFGVLGVGSFVVIYGIVHRTVWAWPAGVSLGTATVIWIVVQIAVVQRYFFLQPVVASLGIVIVTILILPSMRHYYLARNTLSKIGMGRLCEGAETRHNSCKTQAPLSQCDSWRRPVRPGCSRQARSQDSLRFAHRVPIRRVEEWIPRLMAAR